MPLVVSKTPAGQLPVLSADDVDSGFGGSAHDLEATTTAAGRALSPELKALVDDAHAGQLEASVNGARPSGEQFHEMFKTQKAADPTVTKAWYSREYGF